MRFALLLVVALAGAISTGCSDTNSSTQSAIVEREAFAQGKLTGERILTTHYDIRSTVMQSDFNVYMADLLEQQYSRFAERIGPLTDGNDKQMLVYVFDDRRQWQRFTRKLTGKSASMYLRIRSGGFTIRDVGVFYYIGRMSTLSVAAHEAFHQYLHRRCGRHPVPAWLNEGLASVYEAHTWQNGKPRFTPRRNIIRLSALEHAITGNMLFDLRELLATDAGAVSKLSSTRVGIYYAQSWALLSYLGWSDHKEYREGLQQLLEELPTDKVAVKARGHAAASGTSDQPLSFGEAVFRHYIEDDLDEFNRGFREYLLKVTHLNDQAAPAGNT